MAFDPETDSLGVAVQSKFLAVGSVVPWARAGVGAIATQAMATTYEETQGDVKARLPLWPEGRHYCTLRFGRRGHSESED